MYSRNHTDSVERGIHIYTIFLIIFTFGPFSKSNNLTHTAHNRTEETLNENENTCIDYVKRGVFYCPYGHRLARVKSAISDLKQVATGLPDNTTPTRKAGTATKKKTTDAVWPRDVMLNSPITTANLKKKQPCFFKTYPSGQFSTTPRRT